MAFRPKLRDSFSAHELEQIASLMLERGLRIRSSTDDFWSQAGTDDEAELPVDEEVADDELRFLTQAHESRPYTLSGRM